MTRPSFPYYNNHDFYGRNLRAGFASRAGFAPRAERRIQGEVEDMQQKFKVTGMTCAACSAGIQKRVGKMQGVRRADVSLMGECMEVDYDESAVGADEIGVGGMKGVAFMVTGKGAYSRLKYESGVHRVQRVPETESGGRIHTSTITVAVMPEAEDVDVVIDEKDIRIDVMRASGNGGQCVNTTDSAVRLTHYPTGIVVYSQTEKSQLQNKAKAFALLRAKLYDIEQQKAHDAEAELRRSQIGTGDRSEKIRTYNFPQGRVTDHRIKLTLYKIDDIMNGDIDELLDSLIAADQAAKLARMGEV